MAPNIVIPFGSHQLTKTNNITNKPPGCSMETLQRTISDMQTQNPNHLVPEVEDAKCECCGMSEECTPEYVGKVRGKFSGRLICGMCAEAVEGEAGKNGGKREEALSEHMSACMKFNSIGRSCPLLLQAEGMRQILKRANSLSPRNRIHTHKLQGGFGSMARTSSCISAITREIGDREMGTC